MKAKIVMVALLSLPLISQAKPLVFKNSNVESSFEKIFVSDLPKNGVYLNSKEFIKSNPEMGFDKKSKKHKIHEGLFQNKLVLVEGVEKAKFPKTSIWGFRKNGIDFRTVGIKDYKVENNTPKSSLIIYSMEVPIGYKKVLDENKYFFSRNSESAIVELSRENLNKEFANQPELIKAINKLNWTENVSEKQIQQVATIFNNTVK